MFGMCQGSYQLSTNWSTQQTGSLSLHIFSQIRFFNSVILLLQFRNSHKGSNIHHHCRLHFALGVVRLPFASTIMATILSHYFLWQHHHQVLHVDKIYLLYCMHCILCKCRPNCKKALQIKAKNVRNLHFWHHWRQNFSWYAGTVTPIYGIFSLMINCISDITTAVPATGMKNLLLSTFFLHWSRSPGKEIEL